MVFCDNHMIQHCVIPKGFDPTSNTDATFDELVPSTIYANGPHTLGLIVLPKEVVKKMRNGIWRLKDEFYNNKLSLFKDALSHGRVGYTKSSNTGVPL